MIEIVYINKTHTHTHTHTHTPKTQRKITLERVSLVTATGFEPTTTKFVNEPSTI